MLEKIPSVIGKALQGVRPGLEATVIPTSFATVPEGVTLRSSDFADGSALPRDCTEDGSKRSPAFAWEGAPAETVEVVLVVEDADSPTPKPLVHAILYGLPPSGSIAGGGFERAGSGFGEASMGSSAWLPPDPPSGHGPHAYVFQLFALRAPSGLAGHPGRSETVAALEGKVVAVGRLTGLYERP